MDGEGKGGGERGLEMVERGFEECEMDENK